VDEEEDDAYLDDNEDWYGDDVQEESDDSESVTKKQEREKAREALLESFREREREQYLSEVEMARDTKSTKFDRKYGRVPVVVNERELDEKFVRGWGKGGQKVNKTSNCVVLTHTPTGIVVKCQATRILPQNRKIARKIMQARLDEVVNGESSKGAIKSMKKRRQKSRRERRRKEEGGDMDGSDDDRRRQSKKDKRKRQIEEEEALLKAFDQKMSP